MGKKQTRRSISVSRTTYERLKAFCETNNISMSQLVETQVNGFLGTETTGDAVRPAAPRPPLPSTSPTFGSTVGASPGLPARPSVLAPVRPPAEVRPPAPAPSAAVPMTSAAARIAIEPPPPIIKPKQETAAPKPAEKRPEQIFTF